MPKKNDEAEFQIRFFESVLDEKADFIEALIALGHLYTEKGEYLKGLEMDRRLSVIRPQDPVVLYNLACSYSLIEDAARSLGAIKLALECGYEEWEYLEQDEDLTFLRKDIRFQEFFDKFRRENLHSRQL